MVKVYQVIFNNLTADRLTREVPVDWRFVNVTPLYKKSRKGDSGNYRPKSGHGTREGHGADHLECHLTAHRKNQVSRCNHHVFIEYRSCLTDLISFCSKDDREAIHAVYLDVSKELDTFPQYSPGKIWLLKAWTGLHCCVKNWLYSQAQRVLVTGD